MNPSLEKIKKQLRLSRDKSATPAEAATALQMAMRIAAEEGIDLDKVSTEDNASSVTHRTEPATFGPIERSAASLIRSHFNVDALFSSRNGKRVVHLYGYAENCELAVYVFVYLVRAAKAAWRTRTNKRIKKRESFIYGFFMAIDELMPPKFHQPGLMLSHQAYLNEVLLQGRSVITRKITPKSVTTKSLTAGYMAGQKTGINNAIRGTDKPLLA